MNLVKKETSKERRARRRLTAKLLERASKPAKEATREVPPGAIHRMQAALFSDGVDIKKVRAGIIAKEQWEKVNALLHTATPDEALALEQVVKGCREAFLSASGWCNKDEQHCLKLYGSADLSFRTMIKNMLDNPPPRRPQ